MARIIRDETKKRLSVFVILFPEENTFFLSKTQEKTLARRYEDHYYCSRAKTKKLFTGAREKGQNPPMYCLETLDATEEEAFVYCIAWAKYFLDHGMISCCGKDFDRYTRKLKTEAQIIYDAIRDKEFTDVCPPNKDLYPNFGHKNKSNTEPKCDRVNIRVTPEEHQIIKAAAAETSLTITEYCKEKIIYGRVINVDPAVFELLSTFVSEYVTRDQLLKNILTAIYRTKTYLPADLAIIQEAITDNSRQYSEAMKDVKAILDMLTNR